MIYSVVTLHRMIDSSGGDRRIVQSNKARGRGGLLGVVLLVWRMYAALFLPLHGLAFYETSFTVDLLARCLPLKKPTGGRGQPMLVLAGGFRRPV